MFSVVVWSRAGVPSTSAAGIRGTGGRISHAGVSCLHICTSSLGACSGRSVVLGAKNLDLTRPGISTTH